MAQIFKNERHDEFGGWALGYTPFGGPDFGEIAAVAAAVGDGHDAAFCAAWVAAGDRLAAEAATVLAQGHQDSARDLYLRASSFYGVSYRPLFGEPVDPRLTAAFRAQGRALAQGLALCDPPIAPLRIPFEATPLPGFFIPAAGRATETRPLIIFVNGYDGNLTDTYFASVVAASRRGYHSLIFDGPGQGEMLIEGGVRMRPDWETVIRAVVDFALTLPAVDPARIALEGWSLGGYLALRAASNEPRVAACIADPGLFSMTAGFDKFALAFGVPGGAPNLGQIDEPALAKFTAAITANPKLAWGILRRGYWVLGARTLREFLKLAETYTLDGRVTAIACPTLLTKAEHDPLADSAAAVYELLRCPKTLLRFTAAEGAGGHCEMQNRSLANRRILDWLDTTFKNGETP